MRIFMKSFMKRSVAITAAALALGSTLLIAKPAFAGPKYGMAGCGLGSLIFEDKPGKIQILAATTNDFYGNNTSAMTSGTSNCDDTSRAQEEAMYILINKGALERDIARGEGEALSGLLKVMKCSNTGAVSGALQSHYNQIFTSPAVEATDVQKSIRSTIDQQNLSSSCQALS